MITVESIYQARRDEQARRLELRIEGIYQDHPQLKEINNQINLKHLDLARAKLFDPSAAEREELELYELKGDRDRYMKDHDIDPASFKMQYDCNLCQDRGYIVTETAHKKCPCLMKIKEGLRHGQSHISGRIEKDNFDNFDINIFDHTKKYESDGGMRFLTERENILEIKEKAWKFIHEFNNPDTISMLYYGDVGLGKSYMCYAVAKELLDRGKTVLYLTMNELMDMMQLYSFDRDLFVERYTLDDYYAVEKSDLLILDDLGTEITNSFVRTVLFNIINSRMINGKKMIISTNLSPDEITLRYEERISSRLIEYVNFYKFFGENKRWG